MADLLILISPMFSVCLNQALSGFIHLCMARRAHEGAWRTIKPD